MHERLAHVAPLAVIPGAGHVTSLENPVAFNQAVTSFLSAN
jgi:pimeloyl-ACP methyl ester carboxylesterase